MRGSFLLVGTLLLSPACASNPRPVTLDAEPAVMAAMAGEWTGSYTGIDSHRSGSILFRIRAGGDSASGDVSMVPHSGNRVTAADPPHEHRMHAPASDVLAISFVRIAGGQVAGSLEPYTAPDCACTVRTTFTGTVQGETISGTFVTTGTALRQEGTWQVRRRPE